MPAEFPQLEETHCRTRQRRLAELMQEMLIDRVILISHEHIQYLTGFRPHRLMTAAVTLDADGHCILVAPNSVPELAVADQIVTFEAQWHSTLRQEQPMVAATALRKAAPLRSGDRVAVESSVCGPHYLNALSVLATDVVDIEPGLWKLRRRKEPDELKMILHAIGCTEAMYRKAKEIIEPGITEIEVFRQLESAAVEAAGEPLTALGNDFQCNSPGGPPRARAAQAGELFILDLGPAYRGFYADNCRTFAVNQQATDEQLAAWNAVIAVLAMVESTVRPGSSSRELYAEAKRMLDEFSPNAFPHHLGHGIGLYPHEAPHLNPNWDDVFEEGDVFTAEPGLYAESLHAGLRLEQNYRVTSEGVERLTQYPLEL